MTTQLTPELHDKRIALYEANLVANFDQASRHVEQLFRERYQAIPVCGELQKVVGKCYEENSRQTLKCANIASQFLKCVEEERQVRLLRSGTGKNNKVPQTA